MTENPRKHLTGIENFSVNEDYKYPKKLNIGFNSIQRNKAIHGQRIKNQLQMIQQQFDINQDEILPDGLVKDDVIYVEFFSAWGYTLKFDQLDSQNSKEFYKILTVKKEENPEEPKRFRYRVVVMLRQGGISHFLKKVEKYLTEFTKNREGEVTNIPVANDLIANIEDIQIATLRSFWTESQDDTFPEDDDLIWWEVWFAKSRYQQDEKKVISQLLTVEAVLSNTMLFFPEHIVRLVKSSPRQLANSMMFLDSLSELRKPQEINDFLVHNDITYPDQKEWTVDLIKRVRTNKNNNETVLVCVLDSGVNRLHPLLENIIPDTYLYNWQQRWGSADTWQDGGHGTAMAGLILYGNLTEAISSNTTIEINHNVESCKIVQINDATDPELYGVVYRDSCNTVIIDRPNNPRVFCLSITNDGIHEKGRPSSSSATLDDIAFGNLNANADPQLIFVSGGNVILNNPQDYPSNNFLESVHDPGQAYNVITVGAYTDYVDTGDHNLLPIAPAGGMAPCNSTSTIWDTQWPNKPDIVMEGGNIAKDAYGTIELDRLKPVSLHKDFTSNFFIPFNGTSSAVAFASKMAAELKIAYPDFWPETIRGLIIHSADWTPAMLAGRNITNENDRRALLRSVGYGIPSLSKALYSANNSLTLIAQNAIQPFRLEKSNVKYNDFHLYSLPWPKEVLENELFDKAVKLTVTLSYFIEPNPGEKQYANNFSYHSHALDFKLIKPTETIVNFKRRISAAALLSEDDEEVDHKNEVWTINERIRSKGSVKKDFINTTGADLATRFTLAVYPKGGWYRTRKKLNKYNAVVRYSLIVTIETPDINIDIFTPVENLISNTIVIENQ
ncbi:MAG: S8 family peptidase [Saprospiraceae bacterium]|nr:S8 family peptidase [Saprospiraceae bacterium]